MHKWLHCTVLKWFSGVPYERSFIPFDLKPLYIHHSCFTAAFTRLLNGRSWTAAKKCGSNLTVTRMHTPVTSWITRSITPQQSLTVLTAPGCSGWSGISPLNRTTPLAVNQTSDARNRIKVVNRSPRVRTGLHSAMQPFCEVRCWLCDRKSEPQPLPITGFGCQWAATLPADETFRPCETFLLITLLEEFHTTELEACMRHRSGAVNMCIFTRKNLQSPTIELVAWLFERAHDKAMGIQAWNCLMCK